MYAAAPAGPKICIRDISIGNSTCSDAITQIELIYACINIYKAGYFCFVRIITGYLMPVEAQIYIACSVKNNRGIQPAISSEIITSGTYYNKRLLGKTRWKRQKTV